MCSTSTPINTSSIKEISSSSKNQNKLLKTNNNSQLKQKFSKFVKRLIPPCNYCKPKNKKRQQIKNNNIEKKMEEEELNKEINLNKNEIKSKIPFTSNLAAAARLQEQMGLGTPKFPVQWVLGSSELTEEENSDKNNFVYIKNTFDKKLFFFHGKDENENKSQTTNSSSLFNQNSLLEQNQDKNNENKQQILLKEEQQNIEDLLPKKRKKSFKICKCFPTVVRVIVESGAKEIEEETEERIITSSSSTSQLQLNNYNNKNIFTTKHSLTIMASSSSSSSGGISRFRIIPVNSNYYKKGRWQVWDYYNEGIVDKKTTTNTNNILQPKENKIGKVKEREEEEQKNENDISPKIVNTSFNYENESKINPPPPSILSLQNIPTSTSQKLMPRRNSFQLITIKTLEDKNSLNSVPSSISEERLNLIGVNDNTKENNLIKDWIKQQNSSSEFITFPPPHQNNKTPQIVEEPPQKLSEFPSYPLLTNHQPISIESTTTTNLVSTISSPSPNSLSPNITKSISTSPPPPKQMFIQPPPPSSLERQLSIGLNEKEIKENNSPQQQQYFSASFGPGQIQFNGNMNGVGGQNYVEERRRSIARRGSSASTGAVPSTVQQQKVDAGVNIDYKIEQAMDLVKTHLIYAVRDEIELLKSRIVELESNVFHLESENAKLREHIPKEVLANICFDNIQQQFNKQKILFSINNIASNK